ncbi:MAG: hypothetical protein PHI12_07490 [Dehalococcoidales bacterium]|nr:hypothetical protein [Dehalococcoidales bacterium]
MILQAEELVQTMVTKDILCDCCGDSCRPVKARNYEYATFSARWGWDSERDLEVWEAHICENCAVKVKNFIESIGGKVRLSSRIIG